MAWARNSRRRPSPALRTAVRAGAVTALAASLLVPVLRRRLRAPAAVTVGACASGPLGLAVLRPRTKARDAALYALQMWGFLMAHELPYDDPERLRRRLLIRYPIVCDRMIGGGELPSARLQRALGRPGEITTLDRTLAYVHGGWFLEPHASLLWILVRHNDRFARAARQLSATYDLGCAIYFAVPTAPPWWAAENGRLEEDVDRVADGVGVADPPGLRRTLIEVAERDFGRAFPKIEESLGGNPWAAMPSLHFATSVMAAILLTEASPVAGAVGWAYALTLGFALVYLGEHYVTDLVAGAALVAVVRRGEPLAEPLALRISAAVQRLERIASA